MFSRWGAFVYRFRKPVALIAILIALASTTLASQASSALSAGGWLDANSESAAVSARLDKEFGAGKSSIIVLFRSDAPGADAKSAAFQGAITTSLAALKTEPHVTGVVGFAETGDPRFISTAGDAAYVVVQLDATDEESVALVDPVREAIQPPAGYTFQLTGYGPITQDSAAQSEKDLQKAELVSLPVVAVVLLLVFGSLVATGMPLLVAGLAIPSSLALVFLVAQGVEMSIFVLNIATMLGLALAIDYSLFIVSRYREELRKGRAVGEAVERAIGTAGKAVVFSGLAVAIGLSGLMLFVAPAIRSIGIAGALVVLCSVVYALTFLPAVLGMLGHRVNAISIRGLQHRFRPVRDSGDPERTSRWERVANTVMARPVFFLVPTLAVLLVAGIPFLHMEQGVPGAEIYPPGVESRDAYVALQTEFAPGETTPIVILADVPGSPTSLETIKAVDAYAVQIEAMDAIDRVESPFVIHDPKTGAQLAPEQVAALYALPAGQRPAGLDALLARYVRGNTIRLDAISPLPPSRPDATNLIPQIRTVEAGAGIRTQVGGSAAQGYDFLVSQAQRAPYAVGLTLAASAAILLLLFGSVVIPIKAVIMTLLSITASFGAMVWIFQDGNLSNVLNFTPLGYTIAGNPIIMFSVIFGLSMDYEVLLLSRMQEAYRRTADNRRSVAEGLAKTAGVITGAALIMVSVFAAFALADVITIKSIGVGMAIAVFVDATIIRVLLVPATMRLMGRWNWWAPGFLGRFVNRLGFSHVEDDEAPAPAPAPGLPARS
jgi:putative drug exporter of the RND superfamily